MDPDSRFTRKNKLPSSKKPKTPLSKSPKNGNGNNGKKNGKNALTLTPSEKIFADEWLISRNGTQAYKIAYPHVRKDDSAAVCASLLLRKLKVAEYIDRRLEKLSATSRLNQEWVLKRYEMLADYCIDDFFNDDGSMKRLSEIPKEKLYAIGGFKQEKQTFTLKDKTLITNRIKDFKLPSKRSVLDSVAKYLKMFDDGKDKSGMNVGTMNIQVNIVDDDGSVIK